MVHEIVEKQMNLGEPADLRTTVDYTASFGTMAGCIFLAFGEDGIDGLDAMIIDNLAAALPCETELWLGTADDVRLAAVLPANENKRKEAHDQTCNDYYMWSRNSRYSYIWYESKAKVSRNYKFVTCAASSTSCSSEAADVYIRGDSVSPPQQRQTRCRDDQVRCRKLLSSQRH